MSIDTVRLCLNSNKYQRPSGGYKAHSNSTAVANSHKCGIGLEEWLNSDLNVVSGQILAGLGFKELNLDSSYRIAHIEAYRLYNYCKVVERRICRDVDLVTNPARNTWMKIAEITQLRGLSCAESYAIFNYFSTANILAQMDREIAAALVGYPIHYPSPPPNIVTHQAENTFTCIFKVENLRFISPPVLSGIIPARYRRRYK